jgi:hypothetical protein
MCLVDGEGCHIPYKWGARRRTMCTRYSMVVQKCKIMLELK